MSAIACYDRFNDRESAKENAAKMNERILAPEIVDVKHQHSSLAFKVLVNSPVRQSSICYP